MEIDRWVDRDRNDGDHRLASIWRSWNITFKTRLQSQNLSTPISSGMLTLSTSSLLPSYSQGINRLRNVKEKSSSYLTSCNVHSQLFMRSMLSSSITFPFFLAFFSICLFPFSLPLIPLFHYLLFRTRIGPYIHSLGSLQI